MGCGSVGGNRRANGCRGGVTGDVGCQGCQPELKPWSRTNKRVTNGLVSVLEDMGCNDVGGKRARWQPRL